MVEVALGRLEPEVVQAHLLARGAERDDAQRLRLAAREQRRAVRARQRLDVDRDLADLALRAAVRALLVDRDALADDVLLERVEGELRGRAVLAVLGRVGRPGVLLQDLFLDGLRRGLALQLVLDGGRLIERGAMRLRDLLHQVLVGLRDLDLLLGRAGLALQLALRFAQLLDRGVRDVQRVEDLGLGHFVGAALDHQDGLVGAGHDEVHVGDEELLLRRIDDEVALDLADPHRADGRRVRDVGDHQRGGRAVHRQHVVGVDLVHGERQVDQLRLAPPALREQRAQRAVDHARDQRRLLPRAALALEERAGDLARGIHALLHVHGEREEVDVPEISGRRGGQHHGVACRHGDGAGGLLGHLPGLEGDLGPADLDGDPVHFRHMSHFLAPASEGGGPSASS